jgi:2-phospho-L-lactate/phosphoenolpyruvate guanylyltransferase
MRVVLIPMKPLVGAKERLAPALNPEERRRLSLAMLSDVIVAARGFERVWVLNSDADAASAAVEAEVEAVPDPAPGAGLNASLAAATERAIGEGATGVLIVSADLPAVSAADLEALSNEEGLALAPDRSGTGTNALWRAPANAIELAFGPSSLAAHERLAREAGVDMRVVERPGLALDVDVPDDLAAAWKTTVGPATRRALEEMDVAARLRLAG